MMITKVSQEGCAAKMPLPDTSDIEVLFTRLSVRTD